MTWGHAAPGVGRKRPTAASWLASGAFGGWNDQPDVPAGQHQDRGGPVLPRAVERDELGVQDGEELMIAAVHVIGDPAAVALAGKRQHSLDPVPVSLDDNFFLAVVHGGAI